MGDSHIRRAAEFARQNMGYNLGMRDTEIWWKGTGGAVLGDLEELIMHFLIRQNPPDILLVHLGTNDLHSGNSLDMFALFGEALDEAISLLPNTTVIFSELLDRPFFHGFNDQVAMRLRFYECNRALHRQAVRHLARSIKHRNIKGDRQHLFHRDYLHLSGEGYQQLVYNFAQAVQFFLANPMAFVC